MPELPPLDEGLLDEAGLEALLRDIEACTHVIEVRVKGGRGEHATASHVDSVRTALRAGARGVQLRYLYEGVAWSDTVLRTSSGWRVVRMSMDLEPS